MHTACAAVHSVHSHPRRARDDLGEIHHRRDEATGPPHRVLAYHKPAGVLVTHDDELNRPTVYDNLPDDDGARWHAVGRLDADTTGLLLLTNDGKLVQHVTDPVANTDGVVKEYRVRCGTTIDDDALAQLREGVELSGGLGSTQPADVELDDEPRQLRVRIREGKNRQVRRMIQAVGSSVLQLHRERVGDLSLGELGLEEGAWRALSDDEVESALGYACRALDAPAPDGYSLLDSGDGRRLETFGRFTLVRACPSATWPRGLPAARWAEADVAYDGDAWSGRRLAEVEAASAGADADADADGGAVIGRSPTTARACASRSTSAPTARSASSLSSGRIGTGSAASARGATVTRRRAY